MTPLSQLPIQDVAGLSSRSVTKLKELGHEFLGDISEVQFHELYEVIGFDQAKTLLKTFKKAGGTARFLKPDWSEEDWATFVQTLVEQEIVTWNEIAMAVCGELNPPQVGTAIASNKSFQAKFPPRQTMQNVMKWFYAQSGRCASCSTRLFLEADHIKPVQEFLEAGMDTTEADTLDNLQLLCKRCNVIKRPSHDLGGVSFAPAQSVLMWVLFTEWPETRDKFYKLCRAHGLTMANIRFDEAWAFAVWLKREGGYGSKKT